MVAVLFPLNFFIYINQSFNLAFACNKKLLNQGFTLHQSHLSSISITTFHQTQTDPMQRVQSQQASPCDAADPHGSPSSTVSMASSVNRYYAQLRPEQIETRPHRSELSLAHWCHEVHRAQQTTHWWCSDCCPAGSESQSQSPSGLETTSKPPTPSRSPQRPRSATHIGIVHLGDKCLHYPAFHDTGSGWSL